MVPETPNTQLKSEERLIADLSPSPVNIRLDTPLKFENDSPSKLNLNKNETPLKTQSENDSNLNMTIQPSSPTPSPQKVQTPIIRRSTRDWVQPKRYITKSSNKYGYEAEYWKKEEHEKEVLIEYI